MRRLFFAAAVVAGVLLHPAWVSAQTMEFTVRVQSASVHKGPSASSPVIGLAARGTVLEVTRDLGTWVRVVWPDAEDGVGYVHERMGLMSERLSREARISQALAASAAASRDATSTAAAPAGSAAPAVAPDGQFGTTGRTWVVPPTHILGIGARLGRAPVDIGATARFWTRQRFGFQVEAMRSSQTSAGAAGRVTTLDFAPSAIYMIRDHVASSVWVRPYAGAGASIRRASFKPAPEAASTLTDNGFGWRAFGGAELTFPNVPRFAVSLDLGYLWADAPFAGFDPGGVRFSVSGHWYVR